MQCDHTLLWTLIEQDCDPDGDPNSPNDGLETITRHIESCAHCQQQLELLGGDASWWAEASEYLSGVKRGSPGPDVLDASAPLPMIDLSFLDPPSHPETLGRIGRYEVESLLGRGGMGVVLRGYDADLRRTVAIKVLAPEWAASVQARRRFAREAQSAASVAHEHVVPIFNVEAEAPLPYLVMAYVPGMTLERWIKSNGAPDTATVLRVAGQLADGLAAAHRRGLVHRDIKPGNILVGDNIDRVWITDFGLARAADSATLTRTGVIAGTPHYMSPEQARGEAIDHRSDLFSLGCVLYFLASASPPFDADNTLAVLHKIVSSRAEPLAARRTDLPPSFVKLVHQLLDRSVERRPKDCDAVNVMLQAAGEEFEQGRVASPPSRTIWHAAGVAAILVLGSFTIWQWPREHDRFEPWTAADPAMSSRSDTVDNPWQTNSDDTVPANPYVAQASDVIDAGLITGMSGIQVQIHQLQRQADRLDREDEFLITPSLSLDDDPWSEQVTRISEELKRLGSLPTD